MTVLNSYSIEIDLQSIATKLEREKYDKAWVVELYRNPTVKDTLAQKPPRGFVKELKKVTGLLTAVKTYVIKFRAASRSRSRNDSRTSLKRSSLTTKKSLADKVLSLRAGPKGKENASSNIQKSRSPIDVKDEGAYIDEHMEIGMMEQSGNSGEYVEKTKPKKASIAFKLKNSRSSPSRNRRQNNTSSLKTL